MRYFICACILLTFPFVTLNACSSISYSTVNDAKDPRVDHQVAEVAKVIEQFHFVSVGKPAPGNVPDPLKYGIYRGAVPIVGQIGHPAQWTYQLQEKLDKGVKLLHDELHIKTILNLETNGRIIETERKAADKNGVTFISMKLPDSIFKPSDERVNQIIAILKDPGYYPLYVHDRDGEDRTGFVIGLYRHFIEGMPGEQAYQEMKQLGFHSIDKTNSQIGLDCYFRSATGMSAPSNCQFVLTSDPYEFVQ